MARKARKRKGRVGGWLLPTALVAVLAGVLGSGAMVWRASEAAFSGTTENPTNNWTSGTVSLSDDDSNAALFTVSNMTPTVNNTGVKCIEVTYTGSVTLTNPVKLYGATGAGALAGYINLTVESGTGATFSSCTGFTGGTTIYPTGLLSTFGATYTNYANGLSTVWTPTPGQKRAFRFTYTLLDDNNAQGKTCSMPFTWEAQG
jgi:hypothetical protein